MAEKGLSPQAAFLKRSFDLLLATSGLVIAWPLILLAALLAWIDTGRGGFFLQSRVGREGRLFRVIKIRTMRPIASRDTTVTTANDVRITTLGRFLRRTKVDELPQLLNILSGDMSFVGPRPDVPGFADLLTGDDRVILGVRPGITGPATLKYSDEEGMLAAQTDPEKYNREVIYPDKVAINRQYVVNYQFRNDLKYIWMTLLGAGTGKWRVEEREEGRKGPHYSRHSES